MSRLRDLLQVLRSRGYKVTLPRKQVLEVLRHSPRPLSVYDIQRQLRKQGKPLNVVTIYRILNLLCYLNLAHRVLSSRGFVICTLSQGEGCHRFAVCRYCGHLQEFASKELCQQEEEIIRNLGFYGEHHLSEVFGVCFNCQGKR